MSNWINNPWIGGYLIDAARGITPTYSGFSAQAPTDLENATDGDPDTYTGEAQREMSAGGFIGEFDVSLGEGIYICGAKIRTSRSSGDAGTIRVDGQSRPDGTNWKKIETIRYESSADIITNTLCFIGSGDRVRLRFTCTEADGADVFSVWLYNFFAYRLR